MEKRRMSISITEDAAVALKEIAERRGVNMSVALGQAIAIDRLLSDEMARGGRVLIEKPDETIRELIIR